MVLAAREDRASGCGRIARVRSTWIGYIFITEAAGHRIPRRAAASVRVVRTFGLVPTAVNLRQAPGQPNIRSSHQRRGRRARSTSRLLQESARRAPSVPSQVRRASCLFEHRGRVERRQLSSRGQPCIAGLANLGMQPTAACAMMAPPRLMPHVRHPRSTPSKDDGRIGRAPSECGSCGD